MHYKEEKDIKQGCKSISSKALSNYWKNIYGSKQKVRKENHKIQQLKNIFTFMSFVA